MLEQTLRKRPYLLLVTLVLMLVIAFVARDVVRDVLARPLLLALWQAWNMSQGFPQVLVWAIFVATIPVIAVFNLIVSSRPQKIEKPPSKPVAQGQVQTLTQWILQAPTGDYFKARLYRHMSKLTLDTLGYREQLSEKEVRLRLKNGDMQLDPFLLAAIKQGWRRQVPQPKNKKVARRTAENDPQLEKIVEFLETELELEHDP